MGENKTLAQMNEALKDNKSREFILKLFDEESFVETQKFVSKDGATTGIITGYGNIDGATVYAFMQDITAESGAVSKASAAKLKKLYSLAVKNGSPVVGIYNSRGGDVKEGTQLLAAYGDIIAESAKLSGVVPTVSIVDGLCTGAAAMLCCMSDFVIMTETSELFITPPFIAKEGKISGAGSACNAAKSGVSSITAKDGEAALEAAKKLIRILPQNNLEISGNDYYEENDTVISSDLKGLDMIVAVADKDSVIEIYDAFGGAALTALGSINWRTVGFVATNRTDSRLTADDSVKIARFVNMCDAFSIPVVTVIDTEGFEESSAAELGGSIRDNTKLAQIYNTATTVKINLVTGNAIGSAAIAFGILGESSDVSIAFENAVISPLTPKAAAVFLYGDRYTEGNAAELEAEYIKNEANAFKAASFGYIDRVIEPTELRAVLLSALDISSDKRVNTPSRKHINFVF